MQQYKKISQWCWVKEARHKKVYVYMNDYNYIIEHVKVTYSVRGQDCGDPWRGGR